MKRRDEGYLFDFSIDLDRFEEVIGDARALSAFNAKHGKRFMELIAAYEGTVNIAKTFEPIPAVASIRAAQLTFHDNGEVAPPSNGSKEPRTTKTRHSLAFKVWTRAGNIKFGDPAQVAWKANAYLWTAQEAMVNVQSLLPKKLVTKSTVERMQSAIAWAAQEGMANALFSVPMVRVPGKNLKWFDETVVIAEVEDTTPKGAWIITPEGGSLSTSTFSELQSNGKSFKALRTSLLSAGRKDTNQTHQARIDYTGDFGNWSTEVI